jgi:hypothetical protein
MAESYPDACKIKGQVPEIIRRRLKAFKFTQVKE